MKKFTLRIFISFSLALLSLIYSNPTKAFVPYIYKPSQEDLKETGLEIGRTAAKLLSLGESKEAERLASLAVKLRPNDDRMWSVLAEAQLRNKLYKEARNSLSKAIKLNSKNAKLWFADAAIALQQKKSNEAIISLTKGLKIDPNNAGGYFQLGNAQIMQKKLKPALINFQKASKLNKNFWEALNNQGLVLFEIDQKSKAISIWRNVLKIQRDAEPALALAIALNQKNPGDREALDLAREALTKNPKYISSNYQKEQLWGTKLRKEAKTLFSNRELESSVNKALIYSKLRNDP